jgi:hypothetical protein
MNSSKFGVAAAILTVDWNDSVGYHENLIKSSQWDAAQHCTSSETLTAAIMTIQSSHHSL